MGHNCRIANCRTIASIAIVKFKAIVIRLTLAINWVASTNAFLAYVICRAGIFIIAGGRIELGRTGPELITEIVGAGVLIVADNGLTNANSRFTMVAGGAGIAVSTFVFTEVFMEAALFAVAGIKGAGVVVIA